MAYVWLSNISQSREQSPDQHEQAKARSYSSIHRSIASSTKTRSTSVNVRAICRNFGRKPFKAVKIRRRDSGDILLPEAGFGVLTGDNEYLSRDSCWKAYSWNCDHCL